LQLHLQNNFADQHLIIETPYKPHEKNYYILPKIVKSINF
jgi:hypothetical protein